MDLRGTKLVKEMHHLPKGTSSFSTQYCLNCCMIAAGAIHLMTLGVSTTLPFDSLNFLSPKGRSLMICDDVIKSKKNVQFVWIHSLSMLFITRGR